MMAVRRLEALGFSIHCEGEDIICRGSVGKEFSMPEVRGLLAELRANKTEALRYLKSRGRPRAIRAFSRVLNQEVTISWSEGNPKVLHVDRTAYSLTEIDRLKALKPNRNDLRAIHQLKKTFDGELLNDDPFFNEK